MLLKIIKGSSCSLFDAEGRLSGEQGILVPIPCLEPAHYHADAADAFGQHDGRDSGYAVSSKCYQCIPQARIDRFIAFLGDNTFNKNSNSRKLDGVASRRPREARGGGGGGGAGTQRWRRHDGNDSDGDGDGEDGDSSREAKGVGGGLGMGLLVPITGGGTNEADSTPQGGGGRAGAGEALAAGVAAALIGAVLSTAASSAVTSSFGETAVTGSSDGQGEGGFDRDSMFPADDYGDVDGAHRLEESGGSGGGGGASGDRSARRGLVSDLADGRESKGGEGWQLPMSGVGQDVAAVMARRGGGGGGGTVTVAAKGSTSSRSVQDGGGERRGGAGGERDGAETHPALGNAERGTGNGKATTLDAGGEVKSEFFAMLPLQAGEEIVSASDRMLQASVLQHGVWSLGAV